MIWKLQYQLLREQFETAAGYEREIGIRISREIFKLVLAIELALVVTGQAGDMEIRGSNRGSG